MLKFSQFYLLALFLFESDIPYVELYLKLTQYQFKVQLSSIYPKYLYFEPIVLQATSVAVLYLSKNSTQIFHGF